jgi:hypothetical protein
MNNTFGDLAEWPGTGLQNRLRRFESGSRLFLEKAIQVLGCFFALSELKDT